MLRPRGSRLPKAGAEVPRGRGEAGNRTRAVHAGEVTLPWVLAPGQRGSRAQIREGHAWADAICAGRSAAHLLGEFAAGQFSHSGDGWTLTRRLSPHPRADGRRYILSASHLPRRWQRLSHIIVRSWRAPSRRLPPPRALPRRADAPHAATTAQPPSQSVSRETLRVPCPATGANGAATLIPSSLPRPALQPPSVVLRSSGAAVQRRPRGESWPLAAYEGQRWGRAMRTPSEAERGLTSWSTLLKGAWACAAGD